jgi:hypothetical protein
MLVVAGCKKTVVNPTTTITNDTTIIIHNDTTIIINNDTTVIQGDNQIRFSLPGDIVYDTMYVLTGEEGNIHKFNIDYYPDVDSVFYTFYSFVKNGNSGTVELFNLTDNIPIAGSLINVVSNEAGGFYQSGNLTAAFPHKEITLGLRLKGSVQGSYLSAVSGYLYLYRK